MNTTQDHHIMQASEAIRKIRQLGGVMLVDDARTRVICETEANSDLHAFVKDDGTIDATTITPFLLVSLHVLMDRIDALEARLQNVTGANA